MKTVCIAYEVTKKDYINVVRHCLQKERPRGIWSGLIFLALFSSSILILPLLSFEVGMGMIALSWTGLMVVFIGSGILYIRRGRAMMIVRRQIRREEIQPQFFGHHLMELHENGMHLHYGDHHAQRQYAGIQEVEEYAGGIIIHVSQISVDVIPAAAFGDVEQRRTFFNDLQARTTQAKNVGISQQIVDDHKREAGYTLEYAWDESGFITALARANRLLYTTRMGWSAGQIIMTLIGLLFCIGAVMVFISVITAPGEASSAGMISGIFLLVMGFAFLSPLIAAFTPWGKKVYRQRLDRGVLPRDYLSLQALCLKDDRITEVRRLACNDVMYDRIFCVRQDADNMYLLLKGRKILVIPGCAFISSEQRQEIASYIENRKIQKSL